MKRYSAAVEAAGLVTLFRGIYKGVFFECTIICKWRKLLVVVIGIAGELYRGPARRGWGRGSHFACLNFKTSRVGVYKCLSLIVGFAITVTICPRQVVYCRDFILLAVATFWAKSLVGIYLCRASLYIYTSVIRNQDQKPVAHLLCLNPVTWNN